MGAYDLSIILCKCTIWLYFPWEGLHSSEDPISTIDRLFCCQHWASDWWLSHRQLWRSCCCRFFFFLFLLFLTHQWSVALFRMMGALCRNIVVANAIGIMTMLFVVLVSQLRQSIRELIGCSHYISLAYWKDSIIHWDGPNVQSPLGGHKIWHY